MASRPKPAMDDQVMAGYLHNVRLVCKRAGSLQSMDKAGCKTTYPPVPALSGLTTCSRLDVGHDAARDPR